MGCPRPVSGARFGTDPAGNAAAKRDRALCIVPQVKRSTFLQDSLEAAVRAFNRNPWTRELQLVERAASAGHPVYDEDGLRTAHSHHFLHDPGFANAYRRAIQAGGFDYGIRWRTHTILWAARTAARLDGAFVECGTAKGFMASAVCEHLDWTDRSFYLFDTYEPADSSTEAPFYAADGPEPVAGNFREWPGVQLVVGRIPETLQDITIDRVAFLHIDMNSPAPEAAAVRHLWPLLVPGGLMIFDDYGFGPYEASRDSADRLADELGFTVLACPTGQGVVVKT